MSEIVRWYLVECSRRAVEPYYGFVEHIHVGVIRCDIDFVPLSSLRLLVGALNALQPDAPRRVYGVGASSSAMAVVHLRELSLSLGVNKHALHPPKNSQLLKPYATLAARHKRLTATTLLSTASTSSTGVTVSLVHRLVSGLVACTRRYPSDIQIIRIRGIALRLPESTQASLKASHAPTPRVDASHVPLHRFCQSLSSCLRLTTVDFTETNLGDAAAVVLLTAIAPLPFLREVNLSGCDLTDTAADALVLLITSSQQKHAAHAFQTSLRSSEDGNNAARGRSGAGLVHLDVSRNTLGDSAANKIATALRHDMSLQTLFLQDNAISVAGARVMMKVVGEPSAARQLRFLNMSQQGLDSVALGPTIDQLRRSFSVSCESNGQLILSRALYPNPSESIVPVVGPAFPIPAARSRSASATPAAPATAFDPVSSVTPADGAPRSRQNALECRGLTASPVIHGDLDAARGQEAVPHLSSSAGPRRSMNRGTSPLLPLSDAGLPPSPPPPADSNSVEVGAASSAPPQQRSGVDASPWAHLLQAPQPVFPPSAVLAIPVLPWPHAFAPWGSPSTTIPTGAPPMHTPWFPCAQPQPPALQRCQAATQTADWDDEELALLQGAEPLTVADLVDPSTEALRGHEEGAPLDAASPQADAVTAGTCERQRAEAEAALATTVTRMLAGEAALASLAAAVDAQDGRLTTEINLLKLDARMTKQQLQELSESVYSALTTVQGTARQLAQERKQFADAERAREAWLQAHPEEVMERDVVELIQLGIDRIRTQMRNDNESPVPTTVPPRHNGPALAPSSAAVSWAPSGPTAQLRAQPSPRTNEHGTNVESLSSFTDAVKRKLDALGWSST